MYTRFGDNDVVTRQAQELVTSTWSDNLNNLTVAYTGSINENGFTHATSSGHFYIEVMNKSAVGDTSPNEADETTETQYFLSYGHRYGSGSPDFTNDTGSFGLGASRVIYNQYRQLHYNDDTKYFQFGSHTPDDIFVINVARARYKQRLTLGSLNLHISGANSSIADGNTTLQTTVHLTDDSVTNPAGAGTSNLGTYYNIVSGTNGTVLSGTTATTQIADSASYGFYYPEAGLIVLNGDAFNGDLRPARNPGATGGTINTDRPHYYGNGGIPGTPKGGMFHHISAAAHFIVDTTEEINSEFYFCRARNDQYNYTNNESFVDANKNIRFETMKLNPKVFITTVGLYNDAFELLALAKLSQPVAKDFTKEALVRVKLDY